MIKQIITLLAISLSTSLWAQDCIPDTSLKKPGYKPDSLPPAIINIAYKQTITVQSFKDTYRMIGSVKIPVTIDSIIVTSIKNLPAGITYKCLHPKCRFLPLINSCVELSGTPQQPGIYPIKIMITAYAKLNGTTAINQKDSITKFRMIVNGTANTKLQSVSPDEQLVVYPNPASGRLHVFAGWNTHASQIAIYNTTGKNTMLKPVSTVNNTLIYNIEGLPQGIYFLKSSNRVIKFIKS